MQQPVLGVDIHAEVAQKIESQKSGYFAVGDYVVDGGSEIVDFHAADSNGLQAYQRRLDQTVSRLERHGLIVLTGIDGQLLGGGDGNHRIAGAGVDNKFGGGFFVQGGFDNDHLPLLLKRDRGLGQRRSWRRLVFWTLDALYSPHLSALLIGDVVKVIGEVNDPVLIHPTIELDGRDRIRSDG